ncbi:hypothetical protein [Arthrobacter sp. M4]|uniref:hypothetical protein n=1 Tax=Arthrobacter sp. M4 TaxID=218160 RepID=UPI001CDD6CAB|nr:hypothetical protein [Arthrobacter sp. M4]MCA4135608.1 hypothetical protein [Arthrobacter sp. M4]
MSKQDKPGDPLENKEPSEGEPASGQGEEQLDTKVDPDFIPEENPENPVERRAREDPEETGS